MSDNEYNGFSLLHSRITCFQKLLDNSKQIHMNTNKLSITYDNRSQQEYQRLLGLNEILKKEYRDIYTKCEENMKP